MDLGAFSVSLTVADLELDIRVDADNPEGAAHITLVDPDGNQIMIDQFR